MKFILNHLKILGALFAAIPLFAGCKTDRAVTKDAASLKEEAALDAGRSDSAEPKVLVDMVELTEKEPLETAKEPDVTAAAKKGKKKGTKKGKEKGDQAAQKTFKTISPFGPDSALSTGKKQGLGDFVGPDSHWGGGVGLHGGGKTAPKEKEKKK